MTEHDEARAQGRETANVAIRPPRRRSLTSCFAVVLLFLGVAVGLYVATTPERGQMPRYAYVAKRGTPFFAELHLPSRVVEAAPGPRESRLLSERGRGLLEQEWDPPDQLASWLPAREALENVRRLVAVPLPRDPDANHPTGEHQPRENGDPPAERPSYLWTLLAEYATPEARDAHAAQLAEHQHPQVSFELEGSAMLAYLAEPTLERAQAERVLAAFVERVERTPEQEGQSDLGESGLFREAVQVNREHGLFLYAEPQAGWQATRPWLAEALTAHLPAAQQEGAVELVHSLEELLQPGLRGGGGLWLGLDEAESVQHIGEVPLTRSGLFSRSDESMLAHLPAEAAAFAKLGLLESSVSEVIGELELRAPRFFAALTAFAEEAWLPPDWELAEARRHAEWLGDAATGQIALAWLELAERPYLVLAAGTRPERYEPVLTRLAELYEREGHDPEQHIARYRERTFLVDTPREAVILEPEALIALLPLDGNRAPRQDDEQEGAPIYEHYRNALAEGRLTEAQHTLRRAYAGIDPSAALLVSVNMSRFASLQEAHGTASSARPEAWAEEEWVSGSLGLRGARQRLRLNVGLADFAAMAVLLQDAAE